ncbi:MAG: hypothetical protein DMG06_06555 [Acidobacteria bacterium]|nr:MAG: hypothetical protein DMG06_06555 [Acidobacteriota bacterium]
MTQILRGQVVALFAFDVGFEVSLDRLGGLFTALPAPRLTQKKQTPAYLQYARPPRVVSLGLTDPLLATPGSVQAMVFDFGAASIAYRWPLATPGEQPHLQDLPRLSQELYSLNLEIQARTHVQHVMETIRPAIVRPELSALVEDYYLFIIEEFDQPWRAEDLLAQHRSTLAQVLRFETQPLSREQQEEALAQRIAYFQNDLALIDWNAAIIYDRDYWDAANVLELLNVELLEARFIDAELDKRISEYQGLVPKPRKWSLPFETPYEKTIQELAELRIESLVLAKRVENALKLIGDLYLARIHNAATARFYLPDWETAISRKLDIIAYFYQLLSDRVRTAQSHTLELIVIVLILAEIVMAIFR